MFYRMLLLCWAAAALSSGSESVLSEHSTGNEVSGTPSVVDTPSIDATDPAMDTPPPQDSNSEGLLLPDSVETAGDGTELPSVTRLSEGDRDPPTQQDGGDRSGPGSLEVEEGDAQVDTREEEGGGGGVESTGQAAVESVVPRSEEPEMNFDPPEATPSEKEEGGESGHHRGDEPPSTLSGDTPSEVDVLYEAPLEDSETVDEEATPTPETEATPIPDAEAPPTPDPDAEVMTFEEFKQKMLSENQFDEAIANVRISEAKNNYASLDCGAKVIETNPQAQNPTAILIENKDVYMNNPCSAKIWFIVELCELVSVRSLEIACFELFSSIPESFSVFSTERYPEEEWVARGTFQAANERVLQSFPLATDENVYAKYIKVEMLSHFGREHYCPISLLRVMGASMIEVYEESQLGGGPAQHATPTQTPSLVYAPGVELLDGLEDVEEFDAAIETADGGRRNGSILSAAKDAVLSLLEQPLSLLGKVITSDGDAPSSQGGEESGGVEGVEGEGGDATDVESSEADDGSHGNEEPHGASESHHSQVVSSSQSDVASLLGEDLGPPDYSSEGSISVDPTHGDDDASSQFAGATSSPLPGDHQEEDAPGIQPTPAGIRNDGDVFDSSDSDVSTTECESLLTENMTPSANAATQHTLALSSCQPENTPSTVTMETTAVNTRHTQFQGSYQEGIVESRTLTPVDLSDTASLALVTPTPVTSSASVDGEGVRVGRGEDEEVNSLITDTEISQNEDSFPLESNLPQNGIANPQKQSSLELGPDIPEDSVDTTNGGSLGPSLTAATEPKLPDREEPDPVLQHTPDHVLEPDSSTDDSPSDNIDTLNSQEDDKSSTTTAADVQPSQVDTPPSLPPSVVEAEVRGGGGEGESERPLPAAATTTIKEEEEGREAGLVATETAVPSNNLATPVQSPSPDEQLPNATLLTPLAPNTTSSRPNGELNASSVGASGHNSSVGGQGNGLNSSSLPSGGGAGQVKEKSVYLRLSNSIKEMEVNMTLFSSYLEQISTSLKRNRNRTEDAQKLLEKRMSALNDSLQTLSQEMLLNVVGIQEFHLQLLAVENISQELLHSVNSVKTEAVSQRWLCVCSLLATLSLLPLLLAACLCLSCRLRHLEQELRLLRAVVAKQYDIGHVTYNHNHVVPVMDHVTGSHTHSRSKSAPNFEFLHRENSHHNHVAESNGLHNDDITRSKVRAPLATVHTPENCHSAAADVKRAKRRSKVKQRTL